MGIAELSAADRLRYRKQLAKVLLSSDFASSRHLTQFLNFASERAFDGRDHLEQVEIAEHVLGRLDFNPIEDATVRKLATQVRQRLDHYYSTTGKDDDVVITLPVRSYVPRFEAREQAPREILSAPTMPEEPNPQPRRMASTRWLQILLGGAFLAGLGSWLALRTNPQQDRIEIRTARGDIAGKVNDPPPGSILLGPWLKPEDEVSVRLAFTAEGEAQQAGVLIWQDADHFVRFGRKFVGRNMLEFDMEQEGVLRTTPASHTPDSGGQDGTPVWLSVRRKGNEYTAFVSSDSRSWRPIGPTLQFDGTGVRAGLYAFNGRRDAPPAQASFDHFSVGTTFGPMSSLDRLSAGGFTPAGGCPSSEGTYGFENEGLTVTPPIGSTRCISILTRQLAGDTWTFKTRLDFHPSAEVGAGLFLRGKNARYRLVRNDFNGAAISWIQEGVHSSSERDFPGSPALYLRITAKQGTVRAGFSRDDSLYREFPPVRLDSLGVPLHAGIGALMNDIAPAEAYHAPLFGYFRMEVPNRATLEPFR
jgi:hypothetical protein